MGVNQAAIAEALELPLTVLSVSGVVRSHKTVTLGKFLAQKPEP